MTDISDQNFLNDLKSTLNIPHEVTTFDNALMLHLKGAKSYVDSMLDNDSDDVVSDPLYKLTVIYLAQFYYLNRDATKINALPVTINSLLNHLKDNYLV